MKKVFTIMAAIVAMTFATTAMAGNCTINIKCNNPNEADWTIQFTRVAGNSWEDMSVTAWTRGDDGYYTATATSPKNSMISGSKARIIVKAKGEYYLISADGDGSYTGDATQAETTVLSKDVGLTSKTYYITINIDKDSQRALDNAKSQLSDAISSAEAYINGLDTDALKQYLRDKIDAAQGILDNATVDDIDALKGAVAEINQAVADVQSLLSQLASLQSTIATVSVEVGEIVAPRAALDLLSAAIPPAQLLYNTAVPGDADAVMAKVNELNALVAEVKGLTDYYVAILAQLDKAPIDATKHDSINQAIEASTTKDALLAADAQLREATLNYARALKKIKEPVDLTSALVNPSFEYGNLTGWYSKYSGVHNSTVNPSSQLNDDSRYGKYHLSTGTENLVSTGEIVFQPVLNLPVGDYSVTAEMQVNFTASSHAQLAAIVINPAYFGDGANEVPMRDGESSGITDDMVANKIDGLIIDLLNGKNNNENITVNISQAEKADKKSLKQAATSFTVNNGDIVVLSMNATGGLVGDQYYPFRGDNMQLYYLSKPTTTGIEGIMSNEGGEAVYYNLQGVRVANPAAGGIYIEVVGNKARTVRK